MNKNQFWAVYDKRGKVVSISKKQETAKEEALNLSGHRWALQTLNKDWGYLVKEGYTIENSTVIKQKEFTAAILNALVECDSGLYKVIN